MLLLALLITPTWADDEPAEAEPDQAEYNRLTQELELQASKNAWAGAERAFVTLLSTGVEPSFDDLLRGSHAARALGDMTSVHARLEQAKDVREDREVIDWLWQLDENFGGVWLACDPGSLIRLQAVEIPFDPDQKRALEFAEASIVADCAFDGLLPVGDYVFFESELTVSPRVQGNRIDLRGIEIDRKTRKKLQKAARSEEA